MAILNRAIVRGKRECAFMRNGNGFQLIVICDKSWQDQAGSEAKADYILMFNLSPSAAYVWMLLKGCSTDLELLAKVAQKANLSHEEVEDNLVRFLNALQDYALIDYETPSESKKHSPYQLVLGSSDIFVDDVVFNQDDITIEPVILKAEVFCQGLSDPTQGYAQPGGPEAPGCELCC